MRRIRWVLAGLWLVLLLCPATRDMLLLQARLVTGTAPRHGGYVSPWFRPGGCSVPVEPSAGASPEDLLWLAGSGRAYAPDALTAAAVDGSYLYDQRAKAAQKEALERLIAAAPIEPRTWAAVLLYYWDPLRTAAGYWYGAGEPPELTPEQRKAIVAAIASGRSRDPHNAFRTSAEVLLAMADRNSKELRRTVISLSEAWHFSDYREERVRAFIDSCERLGHSRYRAALLYHECGVGSEVLAWPIQRLADQLQLLEQAGRHAEALRICAAVAHLDRLMIEDRTLRRHPERLPLFTLQRLAITRHKRAGEPFRESCVWEEKEGWRGRAWDGLMDYALAHGDTGLVVRAEGIHRQWREANLEYRREGGIIDRLLEPILFVSGLWWWQLILLALSAVAICGAVVSGRVAAGLNREPQSRLALRALGPCVLLTVGLLAAVLVGLAPPSYGLGAASSPLPPLSRVAFAILVGLAALGSPFLVPRLPALATRRIGASAFAACRWLAVVSSLLYFTLTLGQAAYQSWAAGQLMPW